MALSFWPKRATATAILNGRLRQSPHVLATAQGDELVLLDVKREQYYTLNEVGSRAWELLAEGTTRSRIVEAIRREYDLPDGTEGDSVEGDVSRLLTQLHAAGLVVIDANATREHW
jgi:hypothetical protein